MNIETFRQLIHTYGTDPARWPSPDRDAALRLLDESPAARAICDRERELDSFLDTSREPGAVLKEQVRTRVMARVKPVFPDRFVAWFEQGPWRGAAVACLPLLLGVAIGIGTAGETKYSLDEDEEIALLAMRDTTGWIYDNE